MVQVSAIAFTSNEYRQKTAQEKREDIRDTAVAGGAAGAGYTAATKNGGLNLAKKIKTASKNSAKATEELTSGIKTIKESKKAATGLFAEANKIFKNYFSNAKQYANNMLTSLKNMKVGKFAQKVINSKAMKYGCGFFGGVLATCVFISGLGTLYSNTTKVVDNYAPRLADNFNRIADQYSNKEENE